jgi:hypothetical protein
LSLYLLLKVLAAPKQFLIERLLNYERAQKYFCSRAAIHREISPEGDSGKVFPFAGAGF